MPADPIHITVESPVARPEDQAHVLLFGIAAEGREVDLGNDLHQVRLQVHGPAFIQDDILDAMRRGKVDIILVGFGIDASLEVHAVQVPVIPPVPGNLARLHPRPVASRGRTAQTPGHVTLRELLVLPGDDERTPGESPGGRTLGNVVFPGADQALEHVVPTLLHLVRIRGIDTRKRGGTISVIQVHAGIVQQIRLRHAHLDPACGLHRERKDGETALFPLGKRMMGIGTLERTEELRFEGGIVPGDIGHIQVPVLRESEFGLFGHHDRLPLPAFGDKAVGDAVVIGAEDDVISLGRQGEFVEMVPDPGALEVLDVEGFVDGAAGNAELVLPTENRPVLQGHRDK